MLLKKLRSLQEMRCSSGKGFSLIEVSIVILILGIILVGITQSQTIIKKYRIRSAQSLTKASPVNSIPDTVLWLESSLEESFEGNDSDQSPLTIWKDIKVNPSQLDNSATVESGESSPIFSNSINDIHAVKFNSEDGTSFSINGSALNGRDYTIIILEKRQAAGANYFIGDPTDNIDNESLLLGYSSGGQVVHSQGVANKYNSSVDNYSSEQPKVFVFVQDSSDGKKTYINGYLSGSSSNADKLTNIANLKLGKFYTGEIGEVIIFDRALKAEERRSIEKYLKKKWYIKDVSETSKDCSSGTVTSKGCSQVCSVNIIGSNEESSTLNDGESEDVNCNESGYTGSLTYTCSGSSIDLICSCDSGYVPSGEICIIPNNCTGLSIAGSNITSLNHGETTIACNATGYSGNSTGNSCNNGVFLAGTSCGCDAANGYSNIGGSCIRQCSYDVVGATTPTGIVSGSGTIACKSSDNFSGVGYSYNCVGSSISGHCPCATGYSYDSATESCSLRLNCTGGSETTIEGEKVHIFTEVGSSILNCTGGSAGTAKVLVIGGGGGGGCNASAGGGGGGFVYNSSLSISADVHTVVVGAGGNGSTSQSAKGSNGEYSEFLSLKAYGGGGGGSNSSSVANGSSGASGGGGSFRYGIGATSSYPDQGNNGGSGIMAHPYPSGGGGGAGGAGGNGSGSNSGSGGVGKISYIASPDGIYYGGGGGGSATYQNAIPGNGGNGGGGNGGSNTALPGNGSPNTGGGGGGGSNTTHYTNGGNGGSGIVIIRY
jgi:prepilin-type N-terminal cleavage/methylation domain-containing protein